jgi:hypothetical protein
MTLTPFDITPRQPDDPGVRIIPLHRSVAPRHRQGGHAPGSPVDMIQKVRERLNRTRHVEIEPASFWRELIDDCRAYPELAFTFAGFGLIAGMLLTVGLAFVWSMFL